MRSKRQFGFTLIEVMLALAIVGIIGLAVATFMINASKNQAQTNLLQNLESFRQKITNVLNSPNSFLKTIMSEDNKTFICFQSEQVNCVAMAVAAPGRGFRILDASGALVYDGIDPHSGITRQGNNCMTFPSKDCPLRLKLTWRPVCSQTPCYPDQIIFEGIPVYDSATAGDNLVFNPNNYAISVYENMPPLVSLHSVQVAADANPSDSSAIIQAFDPQLLTTLCSDLQKLPTSAARKQYVDSLKRKLYGQGLGTAAPVVDSVATSCQVF